MGNFKEIDDLLLNGYENFKEGMHPLYNKRDWTQTGYISKITEEIVHDLQTRNELGFKKYGQLLDDNSRQDMIQHAYEEALDLTQYLKREQGIIPKIQQLIKDNPKDGELGKIIRQTFFPNVQD
jgi:hypothetical protein